MFCLKFDTLSNQIWVYMENKNLLKTKLWAGKYDLRLNFHSKKLEKFSEVFQNFKILESTVKCLEINQISISTDPIFFFFFQMWCILWKKIRIT